MKKIALICHRKKSKIPFFEKQLNDLKFYEKKYSFELKVFIYDDENPYDRLSSKTETIFDNTFIAAISLGGDGTFLYTARIMAGFDIPIFGINMGKLGFNTTIEMFEIGKYITMFFEGTLEFEYKTLLSVAIDGEEEEFLALNDGVISHAGISRVIRVSVDIDDISICDFVGDGLIVSSPTGSTAYNLSAGGPILHPKVEAFVISPICPHTLAIRPFLVPFKEVIKITVKESKVKPQITLDGQKAILLNIGQKIFFRKSSKEIKVVKSGKSFSEILKTKLNWTI